MFNSYPIFSGDGELSRFVCDVRPLNFYQCELSLLRYLHGLTIESVGLDGGISLLDSRIGELLVGL
jgi:hypothetical protein